MQFYVLGDLRTDDWTYEAWVNSLKPNNHGNALECPICGACVGSLPWLPPYHAEIVVHGSKLGDVIKCSGETRLVSKRFREAWLEEGLRGIEEFSPLARLRIRPARLGRQPLTYFHVEARHYGTQIDLQKGLLEYRDPVTCTHCLSGWMETARGFGIDESSWTGEDFFLAWGMFGRIIVTDRVRQMRDKYGLTNINLVRVEEYLWDPERRWTPYCDYLPDGFTPPENPEVETGTSN